MTDVQGIKLFGTTIALQSIKANESTSDSTKSDDDDRATAEKRPDKIIPCPRCKSMETKFCYFNNYNVNQPRHFCKGCQRYWTAGGALRNVPIGAGRRKAKPPCRGYSGGGFSEECLFDSSGSVAEQLELDVGVVEGWRDAVAAEASAAHDGLHHAFPIKRRRNGDEIGDQ